MLFTIIISAYILSFGQQAHACSTIKLTSETEFLSATNVDFFSVSKKTIFLNKRGMWKEAAALGTTGPQARWFAKWGSLTSTMFGREFALGGMNEAGLIVQMLQDSSAYPELDPKRPNLHIRQSVQYLLDTSSSIDEAMKNLNKVSLHRFNNRSAHWWICEPSSQCAVLEFKNKELVAYRGKQLAISALTNTAYEDSLKNYEKCLSTGCEKNLSNLKSSSDDRFIKASYLTSQSKGSDLLQNALVKILPVSRQDKEDFKTVWTVAYRQSLKENKKEIFFVPESGAKSQWLNMAELDFSCKTGTRFQDITADSGEGNLASHFKNYDKKHQEQMVKSLITVGIVNDEDAKEMIAYPDTVSGCS